MSAVNTTITVTDHNIVQKTSMGAGVEKEVTTSLQNFYRFFSLGAFVETGLIPLSGTGMLSYRQGPKSSQIVYQLTPGKYHVRWQGSRVPDGKRGYDEESGKMYLLAQPYRILVCDMVENEFIGCRHFYSPVPITSSAQPLYHTNMANTNCTGYGQSQGVGWLCLHGDGTWFDKTISQRIEYLLAFASGFGRYNDNMTSHDGPYFYNYWYKKYNPDQYNQRSYLWKPDEWQAKTEAEGVDWTLADDLWIPVKVKSADDQHKHEETGEHLTLDMAMRGAAYSTYSRSDPQMPKLFNLFSRPDVEDPTDQELFDYFSASVQRSSGVAAEPAKDSRGRVIRRNNTFAVPTAPWHLNAGEGLEPLDPKPKFWGTCFECKTDLPYKEDGVVLPSGTAQVCKKCALQHYIYCSNCVNLKHVSEVNYSVAEDKIFCYDCKSIYTCGTCASQYDMSWESNKITADGKCVKCATNAAQCNNCNVTVSEDSYSKVPAKGPMGEDNYEWTLCHNCAQAMTLCPCGFIRDSAHLYSIDGQGICEGCVVPDVNGNLVYRPQSAQAVDILPAGISFLSK